MGRHLAQVVLRPAGHGQVAMGDPNGARDPHALDNTDIDGDGPFQGSVLAASDE